MARCRLLALSIFGLASLGGPAAAQEASPALGNRAEQVVALLRGQGAPAGMFTADFLAQVSEDRLQTAARQLTGLYGMAGRLAGIDPISAEAGVMHVDYERGTAHFNISIEPRAPHRINGLLFTGAEVRGDSLAAVTAEIRALPGTASLAVARLGDGPPALLAAIEPDRPLAIGSAFKLWILAELSRQVQAGARRWGDVVALDRRSIAGGIAAGWPRGSPVTLHTLAALMISTSDNSATDMLLHILGREDVERMMATIGVAAAGRNRPLLSTLELAAIKTAPAPAVNAWLQSDEAGRRRLLATSYAAIDPARLDIGRFSGNPVHIEGVEWFASAADLVRTMDWLRRNGDETARAILAINPALAPSQRHGLTYAGYKGGSEPGVLNLTWLVRDRAGQWHVVAGTWNDPAAPLEEARFVGLMTRAVQLAR